MKHRNRAGFPLFVNIVSLQKNVSAFFHLQGRGKDKECVKFDVRKHKTVTTKTRSGNSAMDCSVAVVSNTECIILKE
jgi:hypothetical protein